ncbi:heat shock protein transcriptional repressor HspR [Thermocrinis jamiesonii]|uniref:heat shock protein transcriptional repressor HspR n=1 Tax=Thermocrinis jamiesonii TaxID=1302351 RepID=UPI000495069F|nr:helix-turn-helix transcriptional regulator [Thermocrinis jamiesonii]
MKREAKKRYTISVVAEMYNIHPQTLRLYEKEGLIKPYRSKGRTRYYTEEDLKRLELVLTLSRELGVNLAGIEIIIRMKEQMEEMERQIQKLLEIIQSSLIAEEREDVKAIVLASKNVIAKVRDIIYSDEDKRD